MGGRQRACGVAAAVRGCAGLGGQQAGGSAAGSRAAGQRSTAASSLPPQAAHRHQPGGSLCGRRGGAAAAGQPGRQPRQAPAPAAGQRRHRAAGRGAWLRLPLLRCGARAGRLRRWPVPLLRRSSGCRGSGCSSSAAAGAPAGFLPGAAAHPRPLFAAACALAHIASSPPRPAPPRIPAEQQRQPAAAVQPWRGAAAVGGARRRRLCGDPQHPWPHHLGRRRAVHVHCGPHQPAVCGCAGRAEHRWGPHAGAIRALGA